MTKADLLESIISAYVWIIQEFPRIETWDGDRLAWCRTTQSRYASYYNISYYFQVRPSYIVNVLKSNFCFIIFNYLFPETDIVLCYISRFLQTDHGRQ